MADYKNILPLAIIKGPRKEWAWPLAQPSVWGLLTKEVALRGRREASLRLCVHQMLPHVRDHSSYRGPLAYEGTALPFGSRGGSQIPRMVCSVVRSFCQWQLGWLLLPEAHGEKGKCSSKNPQETHQTNWTAGSSERLVPNPGTQVQLGFLNLLPTSLGSILVTGPTLGTFLC